MLGVSRMGEAREILRKVLDLQARQEKCLSELAAKVLVLSQPDNTTQGPRDDQRTFECTKGEEPQRGTAQAQRDGGQAARKNEGRERYWRDLGAKVMEEDPTCVLLGNDVISVVTPCPERSLLAQRLTRTEDDVDHMMSEFQHVSVGDAKIVRTDESLGVPGETVIDNEAERFQLVLFIKLAILVFIFDLSREYFSLLSLVAFLHMVGAFDPIVRWFRRPPNLQEPQPLHRVLRRLQQRQGQTTADQSQRNPQTPALGNDDRGPDPRVPDADGATLYTPLSSTNPAPLSSTNVAPLTSPDVAPFPSEASPQTLSSAVGSSPLQEGTAETTLLSENGAEVQADGTRRRRDHTAETQETEGRTTTTEGPAPSSMSRALYQTVVMFVATLCPWWKPNVQYLQ